MSTILLHHCHLYLEQGKLSCQQSRLGCDLIGDEQRDRDRVRAEQPPLSSNPLLFLLFYTDITCVLFLWL